MKKLICAVLTMMFLISALPALADSAPALYRVEDQAGYHIYLLGAVHVGSADMYPLGDAFEAAWQDAQALAVEMDADALETDMLRLMKYAAATVYTDGDTAKNHLSPEAYALGVEKLGQPEYLLNRMRPFIWASLAENALFEQMGFSAEYGVDSFLTKRAKEEQKPVIEMEGLDTQLAIIQNVPDEVSESILLSMLLLPDEAEKSMSGMMEAYISGDAASLEIWIETDTSDFPEELAATFEAYNNMLYHDRNDGFVRQAEEYLQEGKTVLICIGAAHILGEDGLVNQLKAAGYTVTEINH